MKKVYLIMGLVLILMVSLFVTANNSKNEIFEKKSINKMDTENKFVQDEIIVKFKSDVNINEINKNNKAVIKSSGVRDNFKVLKIPKGKTVEDMIEIYSKNPNVEYAEPNFIATIAMVPNDEYYSPYQWHLDNPEYGGINMEKAWDLSTGDGVIVAVLDTGVAYETYGIYELAPDLSLTNFVSGYDFVNDDIHPNDDEGHGTHVTGTIAQSTNNELGVAGVAFDASIMPVKVLGSDGSGSYDMVADGIYFATDNGAKVISMSLSGRRGSITLEDAVQYAHENGVLIVAAAGNDGKKFVGYPAAYDDYVIAVGATRYDETRVSYSNYGPNLDIMAPGGDTSIDQNGDGYGDGVVQQTFGTTPTDFSYYFYQGTSMATPHIAGVAALIISINPALTPDEVRNVLTDTAEDLGVPGRDDIYGWGLVDAYLALDSISSINPDDLDEDGINNLFDNCPNDFNPVQIDTDNDGLGDVCDLCPLDEYNDADGDGVCGNLDICEDGDDTQDSDLDGIPDACDLCPLDEYNDADEDGVCGNLDVCEGGDDTQDSDLDGIPDACDLCPLDEFNDADGDGVCGNLDDCEGGDDNLDLDSDGIPDYCDDDADGDGYLSSVDDCNDMDAEINPDAEEICGDSIDNNCNQEIDETCPTPVVDTCYSQCTESGYKRGLCKLSCNKNDDNWLDHGIIDACIAPGNECCCR